MTSCENQQYKQESLSAGIGRLVFLTVKCPKNSCLPKYKQIGRAKSSCTLLQSTPLSNHYEPMQLAARLHHYLSPQVGLATGFPTYGQVQHRKSAIHGLPVTLRMPRVKSDKYDWFWSQSIVFTKPFKTGMSLNLARGPDLSSA